MQKFDKYLHIFSISFKYKSKGLVTNKHLLKLLRNKWNNNNVKEKVGFVDGNKIRIIVQNPGFNNPRSTALSSQANIRRLPVIMADINSFNENIYLEDIALEVQLLKIPRSLGTSKNCISAIW